MSGENGAARTSPLASRHADLGATMTDFAGWSMPLRYTSELAEHRAVREAVGLFDVSHMGEIFVMGAGAGAALDHALVSRMSAVPVGRAKYTMICAPDGGVIDDLIVYRILDDRFMVVANAGNAARVAGELRARCAPFDCDVSDASDETSLIAVQGPASLDVVSAMTGEGGDRVAGLPYYGAASVSVDGDVAALVGRTGYTGEDGYEFFVAARDAGRVWDAAMREGAAWGLIPCGLACRDSLRLEAGMPLYGNELSEATTPFDAGLGRVVHLGAERGEFVGRGALEHAAARERDAVAGAADSAAGPRVLVGLEGDGKRAARAGYTVKNAAGEVVGEVTSGAPSPTLGTLIAMAMVDARYAQPGTDLAVDVRGRDERMTVRALPFYQRPREAASGA